MSFNTALSGIRAANTDLQVTGNNIANASTVGFKSSRAEFGDVYTSALLGGGSNMPGSGVTIQNIRQQFAQGNLKFTQNELDLSVNGEGFFVVEKNGQRLFTRAGTFGLNKDGYIVNGTNSVLQGFAADGDGGVSGVLTDLRVDVSSQAPRQTSAVSASYNLDSNETVLESTGLAFTTDGIDIGRPQIGQKEAVATRFDSGFSFPANSTIDFGATNLSFTLERQNPATSIWEPVNINISSGTVGNIDQLASLINNANLSSPTPLNVTARASSTTPATLMFIDSAVGAQSNIRVTSPTFSGAPGPTENALANALTNPATVTQGYPQANNNYGSHSFEIQSPSGSINRVTTKHGASAAEIASNINRLTGISATATTRATILADFTSNLAGNFQINDVEMRFSTTSAPDLSGLADEINSLSTSRLMGVTAEFDPATGNLNIQSASGGDLKFSFRVPDATNELNIVGPAGRATLDSSNDDQAVVIGGQVRIDMQEGYKVVSSTPSATPGAGQIFGFVPLDESDLNYNTFFTKVPINAFNPNDQKTYNHATSTPIFDSLGNSHVMRQFFVKQPYDVADPSTSPNHWIMYVQIDGQNVGDPDPTLPSPQNTLPTMASFNVHFKPDGTIDTVASDTMLISNWTPLGPDGQPVGALPPLNVLQGGTVPVAEPPSSSNFLIDLAGSTQFGGAGFAVEELDQNGYATGRLAGLDISNTGIVFARFTNGEAQVLGQVALANFSSTEGLKPTGDTMWAQTFESGEAIIGAPGSAQLGNITAGAVEESNVDLSEQLVNLIIAQRNYQANAKTIETANATTQTIINLR